MKIAVFSIFLKGKTKWEETCSTYIRTLPWNKHTQYSLDLELNLWHRNSRRKMAALPPAPSLLSPCSPEHWPGESPAKQRLVALLHLLSSSKWSIWVGAHRPDPACRMIPLLTAFSAVALICSRGRKEGEMTSYCFVAFSHLTTKKGLSLHQSRSWQTFPWTGLQSTALKTRAFLVRMQTLISTVTKPMKMFSVSSKRKDGRDTWN